MGEEGDDHLQPSAEEYFENSSKKYDIWRNHPLVKDYGENNLSKNNFTAKRLSGTILSTSAVRLPGLLLKLTETNIPLHRLSRKTKIGIMN